MDYNKEHLKKESFVDGKQADMLAAVRQGDYEALRQLISSSGEVLTGVLSGPGDADYEGCVDREDFDIVAAGEEPFSSVMLHFPGGRKDMIRRNKNGELEYVARLKG